MDTGLTLPNSPKYMAKLNLFIPMPRDKLGAGLEAQYVIKSNNPTGPSVGETGLTDWIRRSGRSTYSIRDTLTRPPLAMPQYDPCHRKAGPRA